MSNRLAKEQSPYLLQHKDNPVDWWPWGRAAFAAARQSDRPVFLSIGYATCHWCHVMERESFVDDEVARLMNEAFINVKVDREERPDIDAVYMNVCQLLTGSGGWPLTTIMTPDAQPFFAATYIPRTSRYGRVGMCELVPAVTQAWQQDRARLVDGALEITQAVASTMNEPAGGGADPGEAVLHTAFRNASRIYDSQHGGFGRAPKFPSPSRLQFLMRYARRYHSQDALQMVERTLRQMRRGGIYDQIGGGMHRYSTDAQWLVPHFEKMLCDQALLSLIYTEAFQATRADEYAQTVRGLLGYVLGELQHPAGPFFTAEDADSEGEEGKFYVWTEAELFHALGPERAQRACKAFNTRPDGNYLDESTRERTGANILHLDSNAPPEVMMSLREVSEQLANTRGQRVRPLLDDKVLTDWNGLAIAALAKAGRVLEEPVFVEAATRASEFIRQHLQPTPERLLHRWRNGEAAVEGMLDDYAYYIQGMLELYGATQDASYLVQAAALVRGCLRQFRAENGIFYLTSEETDELIVRPRNPQDGALPSGEAVMMLNLVRMGHITGNPDWIEAGHAIAGANSEALNRVPDAFAAMLVGLEFGMSATVVVVAGDPSSGDTQAMLRTLRLCYKPGLSVVFRPDADDDAALPILEACPWAEPYRARDGLATAHVCRDRVCQIPTTSLEELQQQLSDSDA